MNATLAIDQSVVASIVALLQGRSSEEIEAILEEVRSQLAASALPVLPATSTLDEFFSWQVKVLDNKGLATKKQLEPLRPLLAKLPAPTWTDGRIPFVIVPETSLGLNERMSKVILDGKTGKNWLDASKITNISTAPAGPYLAVDVEDGRAMQNQAPRDCQTQFEEQGRLGLTVDEGMALLTYAPETLKHHYLDLPGSRYDGHVPYLYVVGVRPWLYAFWRDDAVPCYGSASCGSRLGLSDLETLEPLAP